MVLVKEAKEKGEGIEGGVIFADQIADIDVEYFKL